MSFEKLPPELFAVTFSVDGAGGTLKAKADGVAETETSPITVEHGKTVTLTAAPAAGYKVKEWKLGGNAVNGTNMSYTHTITQAINVTVSFEPKKALLTLAAGKNTVKVKAKTADGSAIKVEGCTVTELANDTETTLTVTAPDRKLTLIGDIIELNCSGEETPGGNRPLIALNVSGCTALQKLDCAKNQLTALNVQGLTKLQKLDCDSNQLTTLNVQGLTALQELICYSNGELSTLDVQGCTALQQLNCRNNKITSLNVQDLTELQELDCQTNKLTSLNVQGLTKLQKLDCSGNQLSTLNVQGLTALQKLYCENNQLTTLDVSGLTALQKLYCNGNQNHRYLSELNVQGCTALKELLCYYNKLNADAFIKIFNGLPTREASDGAKAILYVDRAGVTEENCTNFTTPESLKKAFEGAKAKHWRLQKAGHFGFGIDI